MQKVCNLLGPKEMSDNYSKRLANLVKAIDPANVVDKDEQLLGRFNLVSWNSLPQLV